MRKRSRFKYPHVSCRIARRGSTSPPPAPFVSLHAALEEPPCATVHLFQCRPRPSPRRASSAPPVLASTPAPPWPSRGGPPSSAGQRPYHHLVTVERRRRLVCCAATIMVFADVVALMASDLADFV